MNEIINSFVEKKLKIQSSNKILHVWLQSIYLVQKISNASGKLEATRTNKTKLEVGLGSVFNSILVDLKDPGLNRTDTEWIFSCFFLIPFDVSVLCFLVICVYDLSHPVCVKLLVMWNSFQAHMSTGDNTNQQTNKQTGPS